MTTISEINEGVLNCAWASNAVMGIGNEILEFADFLDSVPDRKEKEQTINKLREWGLKLVSAAASITLSNASIVAQFAGLAKGELIVVVSGDS